MKCRLNGMAVEVTGTPQEAMDDAYVMVELLQDYGLLRKGDSGPERVSSLLTDEGEQVTVEMLDN